MFFAEGSAFYINKADHQTALQVETYSRTLTMVRDLVLYIVYLLEPGTTVMHEGIFPADMMEEIISTLQYIETMTGTFIHPMLLAFPSFSLFCPLLYCSTMTIHT